MLSMGITMMGVSCIGLIFLTVLGTIIHFTNNEEVFAAPPDIQVGDLDAYRDGDRLVISGTIRNSGDSDIDEVSIGVIRVSDIIIDQKPLHTVHGTDTHPVLRMQHVNSGDSGEVKHYCQTRCDYIGEVIANGNAAGYQSDGVNDHSGFSLAVRGFDGRTESTLRGGESGMFLLDISNGHFDDPSIDISDNVGLYDELTMVLEGSFTIETAVYEDERRGTDSTKIQFQELVIRSDPVQTNVRPG